jgi:hypothetical protein
MEKLARLGKLAIRGRMAKESALLLALALPLPLSSPSLSLSPSPRPRPHPSHVNWGAGVPSGVSIEGHALAEYPARRVGRGGRCHQGQVWKRCEGTGTRATTTMRGTPTCDGERRAGGREARGERREATPGDRCSVSSWLAERCTRSTKHTLPKHCASWRSFWPDKLMRFSVLRSASVCFVALR